MKKTILGLIGLLLVCCSNLYSQEAVAGTNQAPGGPINILSTPGLFSLTTRLATEYNSLNPVVKINVISSEKINEASFHVSGTNSGFVSGEELSVPDIESLWKMTIAREVITPVVNSKNPFLDELCRTGVSSEKFARIFENPDKMVWGSLLSVGANVPVHLYILCDEPVLRAVTKFLDFDELPGEGINFVNKKEMTAAIQSDPNAVGFCYLADITGSDKHSIAENIKLLPVDKNNNGKIDYNEQIYDDPDALSRGVWIGKYPRALYTDMFYVSLSQPANESETAFIRWILNDGQQYLTAGGFSDLVFSERQSKLDKFNTVNILIPSKDTYSFAKIIAIILTAIIILSIIISAIIYYRRNKRAVVQTAGTSSIIVFNENSVIAPKGLYFDKSHTWAFMEKNGMVRIGIDDFIQHVTGHITRIELKLPGERIKKGDICLSIIQKGKQLNLYAPVSGIIMEHNKELLSDSTLINASPYSDGWVYMIEPSNWLREIQFFDMAEKYRKWLQIEFTRLKDFLATSIKVNKQEYEKVVLQDGGALKDSILEDLGPEVWEDFQTNFLDTSK